MGFAALCAEFAETFAYRASLPLLGEGPFQKGGVPEDSREQVVEVVGDPSGEHARNAFHLMLLDLFLAACPLIGYAREDNARIGGLPALYRVTFHPEEPEGLLGPEAYFPFEGPVGAQEALLSMPEMIFPIGSPTRRPFAPSNSCLARGLA